MIDCSIARYIFFSVFFEFKTMLTTYVLQWETLLYLFHTLSCVQMIKADYRYAVLLNRLALLDRWGRNVVHLQQSVSVSLLWLDSSVNIKDRLRQSELGTPASKLIVLSVVYCTSTRMWLMHSEISHDCKFKTNVNCKRETLMTNLNLTMLGSGYKWLEHGTL